MKGFLVLNDLNKKYLTSSYKNYQGFNGAGLIQKWPRLEEWCLQHNANIRINNYIAENIQDIENIKKYFYTVQTEYSRLIYMSSIHDELDQLLADSFELAGFDYGVVIENNCPIFFSSIANEWEIIKKSFPELRDDMLNQFGLISHLETCEKIAEARKFIIQNTKVNSLESAYELSDFEIVKVYLFIHNEDIILSKINAAQQL